MYGMISFGRVFANGDCAGQDVISKLRALNEVAVRVDVTVWGHVFHDAHSKEDGKKDYSERTSHGPVMALPTLCRRADSSPLMEHCEDWRLSKKSHPHWPFPSGDSMFPTAGILSASDAARGP